MVRCSEVRIFKKKKTRNFKRFCLSIFVGKDNSTTILPISFFEKKTSSCQEINQTHFAFHLLNKMFFFKSPRILLCLNFFIWYIIG